MIIINKNADFSGCGLGKITFKVSNEVNELLDSLYDNLDFKYKLIFQQFVDDIGGLNGDIFNNLYRLVIPAFASNAKECYTDIVTKSVFTSGGGNYEKYAPFITVSRGFGAQFDGTQTDSKNILNFNSIHEFEGSLVRGFITTSKLANTSLISYSKSPMYSHAWQISKSEGFYNLNMSVPNGKVFLVNVLDNNILSFSNNVEFKETQEIDLRIFKSSTTGTAFSVLNNGAYPTIQVCMYFLGKGFTEAQAKKLSDAMWNFYNNLI